MKKHLTFIIAVVLVAIIMASCGGAAPAPSGGNTPAVGATNAAPGNTTTGSTPSAGFAQNLKNPDTLVFASAADPESLDPAWNYETAGGDILQNTYNTLVMLKRDSVTEMVGLLASKWDISSDGKTITFTLRKEATFHSGNPVKASDVAYTFVRGMIQDRASGPQWMLLQPFFGLETGVFLNAEGKPGDKAAGDVVNSQFKGDFAAACTALQKKIVADDNAGTVAITLAQPYGPLLLILTGSWSSIVEKAAVAKLGGWDGNCANAEKFHDPAAEKSELFDKEVGSGPYKLERWDAGNEVTLVADENYWLKTPLWDGGPSGAPKIKRITIKNVPEWGTRFATFSTGDADFAAVPRTNISQVDPLVKEECELNGKCTTVNPNGTLRVFKNLPNPAMVALQMTWKVNAEGGNNTIGTGKLDGNGIPPDFFKNIHIRKAFNYCFDGQTYLKEYWKGEAEQAFGPILNGSLGYDPNQAHYTYDIGKCKAEFEAASKEPGYEGLLDKGFFVQFVYQTGAEAWKTLGEILKGGLAKANPKFKLGLADEPWPVLLKDNNANRLVLSVASWLEDYHDPHDWVQPYLSSQGTYSGIRGWDPALYKQFDDLILKAVTSADQKERDTLYKQIQNLAYENALYGYMYQPLGRHYEQTWIKGYYYNPIYPGFYYSTFSKGQ